MKKSFCLIAMALLLLATLYADVATGYYSGKAVDGTASASTKVSLDIGTGENSEAKIELYFIESEDKAQSATSAAPGSPKASIGLAFNSVPNVADNSNDGVYAWWRVLYGGNLDVQLGIEDPLTKDGSTSTDPTIEDGSTSTDPTIDWNAKWNVVKDEESVSENSEDDTTVYSNTDKKSFKTIVEHSGGTKALSIGQAKIDIKTDSTTDYTKIGSGTYSANLILKCVTEN